MACDRLVGRVRRRDLFVRQCEHPCNVERHVAIADHHHALGRCEVEVELLVVGMAVVPGDELRRCPRAAEVLAGDPEAPVGGGAVRIDDRVVQPHEVVVCEIAPDFDVPEEAKPGLRGDLLEGTRDRLQLWVIGRDAEPDETPRRGQALDDVDLGAGCEQRACGIEPGRAGADHGDA